MTKAFVFGKFLPFHKGHEAMINFALSKCEFLTVLVCCSDKEGVSSALRMAWIEKAFEKESDIEIRLFNYLESELPNTSESSESVSKIWAGIFKKEFPDYSLLITSEDYGEFVASFMDIQHIAFDIPRNLFPVSATAVRRDLFANWKFLPDSVKPDFAIKVVILGTESTGKSTLSEKLSKHFNCCLVLEAAREIIDNSNDFSFEDLNIVATEHARRIDKSVLADNPIVIIDTDIHTTISYSRFIFKKELETSADIYNSNRAHLYIYLNNDVEYMQDGTRLSEAERNLLDLSHRQVLLDHNIEMVEIRGGWEDRFEKAVEEINKLIATLAEPNERFFVH
jgi:HTH-type transcriptional regulator, transcriptional repressor of NAD biosynthesis genes